MTRTKTYVERGVGLPLSGAALHWNLKTECLTLNLNPLRTCRGMPCFQSGICYALGGVYFPDTGRQGPRYRTCVPVWEKNTELVDTIPQVVGREIGMLLSGRAGYEAQRFFRWHSSGEMTTGAVEAMLLGCELSPRTQHLVFTKRPHLLPKTGLPPNLSVVRSMWPGLSGVEEFKRHRHAMVVADDEASTPPGYVMCPGACAKCRICWNPSGKNIAFRAHGSLKKRFARLYRKEAA